MPGSDAGVKICAPILETLQRARPRVRPAAHGAIGGGRIIGGESGGNAADGVGGEPRQASSRFTGMVTTAIKLGAPAVIWTAMACAILAQTPKTPGPTVPGPSERPLPVPKSGETIVINPTSAECKAGWRPGLRWTQQEFAAFCRQFEISK